MAIDLFAYPCGKLDGNCNKSGSHPCKEARSDAGFGICDDPPPSTTPAYIDISNPGSWVATVQNPDNIDITFKAIDKCVELMRPDGSDEFRCDCALITSRSLVFIELKDRHSGGWLSHAMKQLETTINIHRANPGIVTSPVLKAYACNKQRPSLQVQVKSQAQDFFTTTGVVLKVESVISISRANDG
jgi:hypothetical protein